VLRILLRKFIGKIYLNFVQTKPNAFFCRWKVELYIQPADYIPWVFVTLAGAAAILATVVATLNWMEKREDRLERRKALHIVNFDAL
jgi:hypothetical protein